MIDHVLTRRLDIAGEDGQTERFEITADRLTETDFAGKFTFHCWAMEDEGDWEDYDNERLASGPTMIHPAPLLPRDAYATATEALDAGEARLRWMLTKPDEWEAEEEAFWARVKAKEAQAAN